MKELSNIFLKQKWWKQVVIIVILSLFYVQIAGIIGTRLFVPLIGWSEGGIRPAGEEVDSFKGRFVRWDAGYYLRIARDGYRVDGTERAFFPLYPMTIRLVHRSFSFSFMWSGMLVSLISILAASLFLYRWVRIDYSSEVALWSVIWLCIFPMAFFFFAFYAESLLLLTSVASIYFARKGDFILSGLAIGLAGATRPTAFLLAIPYVMEFFLQQKFDTRRVVEFLFGGLLAPLGTLGYLSYLSYQAREYHLLNIYSSTLFAEWKRSITWPWKTFTDNVLAIMFGRDIKWDWFSRVWVIHDQIYALLGLILSIWSLFRLRLSTSLFLFFGMIFLYSNHGPYGYAFTSISRYMAVLFPFYLIFALLTRRLPVKYRWIPILISISLLGFLTAWFTSGRWVA